eukprot:scaffold779_cov189-Ochromonas_danica.AAC.1
MALHNYRVPERTCRDNPEQAMVQLNIYLKTWQQLDLMTFMNLDTLFTIIALTSFAPESELRQQATMAVLQYVEQQERGEVSGYDLGETMPIYNYLTLDLFSTPSHTGPPGRFVGVARCGAVWTGVE